MRGKEERKIEAQFQRMMSSKPYAPYTVDELGEDFSGLRIGPPYPLLLPLLFVNEDDNRQQQLQQQQQQQQRQFVSAKSFDPITDDRIDDIIPAALSTIQVPSKTAIIQNQSNQPDLITHQQPQPQQQQHLQSVGLTLVCQLPYVIDNGDQELNLKAEKELQSLLTEADKSYKADLLKYQPDIIVSNPDLFAGGKKKQEIFIERARERNDIFDDDVGLDEDSYDTGYSIINTDNMILQDSPAMKEGKKRIEEATTQKKGKEKGFQKEDLESTPTAETKNTANDSNTDSNDHE